MSIDLFGCTPGPHNSIMDIAGIGVGHAICDDGQGDSGVTVIATPSGATASVDVRGGGPGTRETDLLSPPNTVEAIHAIALCGGSAFGLDAATGAMAELEHRGIGFPVLGAEHPDKIVPIVPAAVIFDLLLGKWDSRPTASTGRDATRAALAALDTELDTALDTALDTELDNEPTGDPHASGNLGAGLGAAAGALKGGFGQASAVFPEGTPLAGVTVAAAMVVNPQGAIFDPATGLPWGVAAELGNEFSRYGVDRRGKVPAGGVEEMRRMNLLGTKITTEALNTTIGVVATDAPLTKAQAKRMAMSSHDGLARAIRPAHMPMDGDTIFGMSVGEKAAEDADKAAQTVDPVAMSMISAVAANAVERAIVHAVLAAETAFDTPSWRDVAWGS